MEYDKWKLETPDRHKEESQLKECRECCNEYQQSEMNFIMIPEKRFKNGIRIKKHWAYVCNECLRNY